MKINNILSRCADLAKNVKSIVFMSNICCVTMILTEIVTKGKNALCHCHSDSDKGLYILSLSLCHNFDKDILSRCVTKGVWDRPCVTRSARTGFAYAVPIFSFSQAKKEMTKVGGKK